MNRNVRRIALRTARLTSLYIVVIGLAVIILFPLFFLVTLSFMSELESLRR